MRRQHVRARRKTAVLLIAAAACSAVFPAGAPRVYAEETEAALSERTASEKEPDGAAKAQYDASYDPSLLHIDETLYVNLDYYGTVRAANVVKGISSSKNIRYQDYGSYSDVINMTNEEQPVLTKDGVAFNIDGNGKKFFFQGTMPTEEVALPWNIELSYKLNGVPVEAEALAGASGVVEIDVAAHPNEAASEYLKNNMLLSVVIPADDSIYSVDAPGSQTQSVGSITGTVFTALPGEDKTFTARLGTDSYKSIGVIIMMLPATLDSFDNIADLKHLKDTWKDSGDALYQSLDQLIDVAASLRTEMNGLSQSLEAAERARETISNARPGVFSASDKALSDLMELSVSVQKMIPYLSTAQTAISEVHQDLGALTDTLGDMTDSVHTLYRGLNRLEDGSYGVQYDLSELSDALNSVRGDREKLSQQLSALYEKLGALLDRIDPQQADLENFGLSEEERADIEALRTQYEDETASVSEADADEAFLEEDGSEQALFGGLLDGISGTGNLFERLRALLASLQEKLKNFDEIIADADALLPDAERLLSGAGKTAQGAKYTAEDLRRVIERTEDLRDTLDVFYPDLQSSLTESEALLGQTSSTLNSTGTALTMAQQALEASSGDADAALSESIRSGLSALDKSLAMLDSLEDLQTAGGTAKTALDGEVDKFEDENRFLDMDPNAQKESFTSEQNREPDSLQIILRTDEIEEDDDAEEVLDADAPLSDAGLWTRIKSVFVRIFEAIRDIFSEL